MFETSVTSSLILQVQEVYLNSAVWSVDVFAASDKKRSSSAVRKARNSQIDNLYAPENVWDICIKWRIVAFKLQIQQLWT